MQQAIANFDMKAHWVEAILMARIVDRARLPLDPHTVRSVVCSVYEIDSFQHDVQKPLADYDKIVLNVPQVIYGSLRTDAMWLIDETGYNFCHRIRLGNVPDPLRTVGTYYEVRYWIARITGETTIVRFRLRVN